jgi:plastocyanin
MLRFVLLSLLTFAVVAPASADEAGYTIAIKDHQFVPSELTVPAGVKLKLLVRNEDATTSEFESIALHREKIVSGGGEITVFIGPLDPGSYEFFDDFHPETRGHVVAK